MMPTKLKFKNVRWMTPLNVLMVIILVLTLLYVYSTFTNKASPDYHQPGAIFGMVIVIGIAALYIFLTDRMRQTVSFDNGLLVYTKGHLWKSSASIDLHQLAYCQGFELRGGRNLMAVVNRGLELRDSSGTGVDLLLNAFSLKHRRELVAALSPYLDAATTKKGDTELVSKTLTFWTQRISDTISGRQYPEDMA